jgi:hypothetical protein
VNKYDQDFDQYVDCEVELNPTGRITWVHTTIGSLPARRALVVGATMLCEFDRMEEVVGRAFPYAEPDTGLPSGNWLILREGKSPG